MRLGARSLPHNRIVELFDRSPFYSVQGDGSRGTPGRKLGHEVYGWLNGDDYRSRGSTYRGFERLEVSGKPSLTLGWPIDVSKSCFLARFSANY